MKKYFRYQFPWQLLMILIFVQSSIPKLPIPDLGFDWQDKLLHFTVYGVLALLIARGIKESGFRRMKSHYLLSAVVLSSFYGLTDEIHQYFVPGRYTELSDWIANTVGAITIIIAYYLWERIKIKNKTKIIRQ